MRRRKERKRLGREVWERGYQRFLEKQRERERRALRQGSIAFVAMLALSYLATAVTYNWIITVTATQVSPLEREALQIALGDQNVKDLIANYVTKYGATATPMVRKESETVYVIFLYRKYVCHTENSPALKAVVDMQRRAVVNFGPL